MAKQQDKRTSAYRKYKRRCKDGTVNLKQIAEEVGVSYDTIRRWKNQDQWDKPKQRGGQPGNKNSKGHKNAKGPHPGAPAGNRNAEKDGVYSVIRLDELTEEKRNILEQEVKDSATLMAEQIKVLRLREKIILDKIAMYESCNEDELFLSSLMDMRKTDEKGNDVQVMGMYSKDTAFNRVMKLNEALYKIQGRIISMMNAMKSAEEHRDNMELRRKQLELAKMKLTGCVDVDDLEEGFEE